MKELRFTETRRDEVLILSVCGEVDMITAPSFRQKLADIMAAGETKVILDLRETSYIASSGLGAISQAAKDIRVKGGELCLARVHYLSREVMKFFGLMPIVRIYDNIEEAVKILQKPPQA